MRKRRWTNSTPPYHASGGLVIVVCWSLLTAPASAGSAQSMLEEAVREYTAALGASEHDLRTERFQRARRLFSQVIDDQHIENAQLFVNLGNAALQCEQLGQAILAYRRALAIEPGHAQARQNLDYARERLPNWVPRPQGQTLLDTFFFWHQTLSRSGRSFVAALCFAVAASLLAIAIRWQKAWARNTAVIPALLWFVLMGLSIWGGWKGTGDQVVITVPEVVARAADSAGAPPRFAQPLPGGTEARVLERRSDWVQIRLSNGRDAWVRASSVSAVQVPAAS